MEADESPIAKLEKFSSEIIKGKSSITTEYGKLFNGVDKFDALLSHIGNQPRKEGWCKILVFHLIRITIVNSFVIYENIASKSSQMVCGRKSRCCLRLGARAAATSSVLRQSSS